MIQNNNTDSSAGYYNYPDAGNGQHRPSLQDRRIQGTVRVTCIINMSPVYQSTVIKGFLLSKKTIFRGKSETNIS